VWVTDTWIQALGGLDVQSRSALYEKPEFDSNHGPAEDACGGLSISYSHDLRGLVKIRAGGPNAEATDLQRAG
jgi:hypothetical protein